MSEKPNTIGVKCRILAITPKHNLRDQETVVITFEEHGDLIMRKYWWEKIGSPGEGDEIFLVIHPVVKEDVKEMTFEEVKEKVKELVFNLNMQTRTGDC